MKLVIHFSCILLIFFTACTKDPLDPDKVSDQVELSPGLAAPLIKGNFSIVDLYNDEEDTLFVFDGDSIKVVFSLDSVFSLQGRDILNIPEQQTQYYDFTASSDIPAALMPDTLFRDSVEHHTFSTDGNMRIDSVFTNEGFIRVDVSSDYHHTGMLYITSPSLYSDGEMFHEAVQISRDDGNFSTTQYYPLNNSRIYIDHDHPGSGSMEVKFDLFLYRNPGEGIIAGEQVLIEFTLEDIDTYEAAFGYLGDTIHSADTLIDIALEEISGLSGTFNVTDPRINYFYTHSMGFPMEVDMNMHAEYEEKPLVVINPESRPVDYSSDYTDPEVSGMISYDKTNILNIGDFISFPPPVSIAFEGGIHINPDNDTSIVNFVLGSSKINVGLEVEVPLEFRSNLQFRDTMKLDFGDMDEAGYIEKVDLYYWFTNEFPVNIDATMILYDSIAGRHFDTIPFSKEGDMFIQAAAVDDRGFTMLDRVVEQSGFISLDQEAIDRLFHDANKMILTGKFVSYDHLNTPNVTILNTYRLNFKFGIDADVHYQGNLSDESDE